MNKITLSLEKIIPKLSATFYIDESYTKPINEMREALLIDGLTEEEIIEQKNIALAEILTSKLNSTVLNLCASINTSVRTVNKLIKENKICEISGLPDMDFSSILNYPYNEKIQIEKYINGLNEILTLLKEYLVEEISNSFLTKITENEARSAKKIKKPQISMEYGTIKLNVCDEYGSDLLQLYFEKDMLDMKESDFLNLTVEEFKEKFKCSIKKLIEKNLENILKAMQFYQKTMNDEIYKINNKDDSIKIIFDVSCNISKKFEEKLGLVIFEMMEEQGVGYKLGNNGWYEYDDSPIKTKRMI